MTPRQSLMVRVGVHVSIAKSLDTAIDNALEEKCDTFQIFTRNPRGWKFSDLDPEEAAGFKEKLKQSQLDPAVDHMPYLPNLSCPEDELYQKSTTTLTAEVERCIQLGIPYLVTHLGSHLGAGREVGLRRISNALTGPKTSERTVPDMSREHGRHKEQYGIKVRRSPGDPRECQTERPHRSLPRHVPRLRSRLRPARGEGGRENPGTV